MALSVSRAAVMPIVLPRLLLFAALASAVAHADDDAPWAEVRVGDVADDARAESDVLVVAIDGSRDIRAASVHRLAPGMRSLRIASEKRSAGGAMTSQLVSLVLRPCTRYTLVADHSRPEPGRSWLPTVKSETPIDSCRRQFGDDTRTADTSS